MGHRPPKGVRPPQLEGKRMGRPKGSRNNAQVWAEVHWGYLHRNDESVTPPTPSARMWQHFANWFPEEVKRWLIAGWHI
jgi:hypothetical protein